MPVSAIKFIKFVFQKYKKALWSIALFSTVINLLILAPSVYMLQVYDRVLPSRNEMTLLMLSIILVGLLGIIALLEYCRSMIAVYISEKVDRDLSNAVYQAAFYANLAQKNKDAANYLNDVTAVRQFFTGNAIFAFIDAPWFPLFILIIFLFNPWLGAFALLGAGLLIILAIVNQRVTQKPLAEAGKTAHQSTNIASANLHHAGTIEAMGMLPAFQQRWWTLHQKFIHMQQQASEYNGRITAITRFVRMSLQSLILGLGGWLAIRGELTPGMMIAGSILLGRALAPIEQLIIAWKQWGNTQSALLRLERLLTDYPLQPEKMTLPAPQGALSVEKVSLCTEHDEKIDILQHISFQLKPGDLLGVIGSSASGKSTLARLLVGIQSASSGIIRFDGADINHWNRAQLGPAIGYLSQEVEIFAGTIAENIARFADVDADRVIEAAKNAGVHEMILRLPAAYDTPVGNGGIGLSGGQKQRIALARALYGSPKLLVLDEPDASLDDAGLMALAQALAAMQKKKTTIILITHRKQLLALTNKVLIMHGGQIKEFGETRGVLNKLMKQQKPEINK
ncbi:type I secretion system permease/ATPase [Pantoea alhagi]|uniref:type I secretion system permease/ATPase n=1 Tax=Pantoea alhagi TaxID=1891675 RepID=UPI00202AC685|nr:type I secretion system permease/ATPase [Pantoea alhagi]URQ60664.1 type I secretion system permease/ATPase [Pantoea alhagi]